MMPTRMYIPPPATEYPTVMDIKSPSSGDTLQVSVGTSAVQVSSESIKIKSVVIKADNDNSGVVYVGFSSGVSASSGMRRSASI